MAVQYREQRRRPILRAQNESEATRLRKGPIRRRGLDTFRRNPGDILGLALRYRLPRQEPVPVELREFFPDGDHPAYEGDQRFGAGVIVVRPLRPADRIVLAIGIIVAALAAAHL